VAFNSKRQTGSDDCMKFIKSCQQAAAALGTQERVHRAHFGQRKCDMANCRASEQSASEAALRVVPERIPDGIVEPISAQNPWLGTPVPAGTTRSSCSKIGPPSSNPGTTKFLDSFFINSQPRPCRRRCCSSDRSRVPSSQPVPPRKKAGGGDTRHDGRVTACAQVH
jgi:hypothetical protein